ncbi:MAG: phosphohistidine phosphatase SixA [Candidatus Eremiobacteraeota bacterium]|nr:phosphohistidine phosphatase SixA [Candidatus Eremiobacteraeota bacterium]
MELYLLRHGLAYERDPKKYPDDRLRPLTIEGVEKIREIVRGMLKLGVEFDAILDSGYTRARQTAEAVTDAYRIDSRDIRAVPALEPEHDPAELIPVLDSVKDARRVLFVGHEPQLGKAVRFLTCRDGLTVDFKKGALCRIDFETVKKGAGKLTWLLPPKVLRKIR